MLKKSRHFSSHGRFHLVNPEYLDSVEISELIDDLCRLLGALTQQFSGRILLLTPFPRHLSKCCHTSSHKLPASSRFPNIEHYIDSLSVFVARHPKLRVFSNVEVVCHWEVFGSTFLESWQRDGVHFNQKGNNVLTSFLANTVSRKPKRLPTISDPHMAFDRWLTLIKYLDREFWADIQDPEYEAEQESARAEAAAARTAAAGPSHDPDYLELRSAITPAPPHPRHLQPRAPPPANRLAHR